MDRVLRITPPKRTCIKEYKNYSSYKLYLKNDFMERCGYCNGLDRWSGGSRYYHIDHFKPKKLYPELEVKYNNLVYACSVCNIFKKDNWSDDEHNKFLDPCDEDLNLYFSRDRYGRIIVKAPEGKYMYEKLKLYLPRHGVSWNLCRIRSLLEEINEYFKMNPVQSQDKKASDLMVKYRFLVDALFKYHDMLVS